MVFQKGNIPWMKGRTQSEEAKLKMSLVRKGKKLSEETKLKMSVSKKGHKFSEEAKKHMSEAFRGRPSYWKGKHIPEETREKIRNTLKGRSGSVCGNWKGGKIIVDGYYYIYSPNHPNRTQDKYVCEHRLVMEQSLNRFLSPDEIVHHVNSNKLDNRIENLILFASHAEHKLYHNKLRVATV